jgi:Skp family chaperone for outer membrane proteins
MVMLVAGTAMANSFGYIDTQLVVKQYNKAIAAQSDLVRKQKELQDIIIKKQNELETAKTANKTEDELSKMKDAFEEELQPKRDELLGLNQKLSTDIEKDIISATKKIAKQLRIELVLDKQVVLVGGTDLTNLVTSYLNK